ncbi:MAG: hypothetical protein L6N96_02495 [Candidatus Methylarchaceae archaeon HK02M2]|nr:hypothetical protein [Candidatus Methylarchaceae archaeon HK02M2]
MPTCPTCRSKVLEPLKAWPIVEPQKNGEIKDYTVGIYWCTKCNTKFPFVLGKRSLKLIETNTLVELHNKFKTLEKNKQELLQKVENLEQEKRVAEMGLILTRLKDKAENLKVEVSLLKKVKNDLEGMIQFLDNTLASEPNNLIKNSISH